MAACRDGTGTQGHYVGWNTGRGGTQGGRRRGGQIRGRGHRGEGHRGGHREEGVQVEVRDRLRLEGGGGCSAITTLDKKACEGRVW